MRKLAERDERDERGVGLRKVGGLELPREEGEGQEGKGGRERAAFLMTRVLFGSGAFRYCIAVRCRGQEDEAPVGE